MLMLPRVNRVLGLGSSTGLLNPIGAVRSIVMHRERDREKKLQYFNRTSQMC